MNNGRHVNVSVNVNTNMNDSHINSHYNVQRYLFDGPRPETAVSE